MFRNIASDVLGLSDIGKIIDPKDFDKTDIDEYVFQEDGEKIYAVIKSKTDEYCFTNLAFIHLDGTSAASKKRNLYRYLYKHHAIENVSIETAGTVDLDAELKFDIGGKSFSIDIDKKQVEKIRDLYKAIFMIAEKFKEMEMHLETLNETRSLVAELFQLRTISDEAVLSLPDIINQTVQQLEERHNKRRSEIRNANFAAILERYIRWHVQS
jgi:hypothetical protein